MASRRSLAAVALLAVAASARAQTSADWPVYGGSDDHSHYTTLGQITPANVKQLKVAWTYDTHDAFAGSEMQTNPVVIDGVLYGTSPKLRVFALDAATGRELWSFDPNNGAAPTSRIRHRGVVVTGDRVLFNYRNRLYALDRRTGRPIRSFGDSGWVDLRAGLRDVAARRVEDRGRRQRVERLHARLRALHGLRRYRLRELRFLRRQSR